MKHTLTALALFATFGAQAANLGWTETGTDTLNQVFDPSPSVGLSKTGAISLGQLFATSAGTITITYLGQESGFLNKLELVAGSGHVITEGTVGDSVSAAIGAGTVDFRFFDSNGGVGVNGGSWTKGSSIGLIATNHGGYEYVLGFNDSGTNHNDWDDYVVGINLAPVPEPGTWALMLAGLAAAGSIARRRRA